MSLVDFSEKAAQQTTSRRNVRVGANGQPLPAAKLWLNVGFMQGDRFVNLPLGLPVDTMEPVEIRGTNQDWIKFQHARNDFLEALKGLYEKLSPGDEMDLPNLIVKVRRINGEVAIEGENEYATDMGALLGGGTVTNPANARAEAENAAASIGATAPTASEVVA